MNPPNRIAALRMSPVELRCVPIFLNETFTKALWGTGEEKSFISEEVYNSVSQTVGRALVRGREIKLWDIRIRMGYYTKDRLVVADLKTMEEDEFKSVFS
ncbi:hypothetical protein TNCV_3418551 [Trichonephila clavipes]|nr:hypothetical protein TNCV_3418551 [Trichonephila clavipes]